ncbi:MAG: PD-(D/E)XK nuclease family protein, partial [Actinomycetota bacterium]|nr:PD-(D/E)XK nuclease family protein [Actinomycetota bacterium]
HERIRGTAGTGKTTTLLARYVSLLETNSPSALLVVCRNRAAANRFRDRVLDHLAGGFDSLPITTWAGVAFDIAVRHGAPVTLLNRDEQLDEVARLLSTEGEREWPTLHRFLGRRAFVEQVAGALTEIQTSLLSVDAARKTSPAWNELGAFAGRYQASLEAAGLVDFGGLAVRATTLLNDPAVRAVEQGRYSHVLIDDYEDVAPVAARLVGQLSELGATVTVAGNPPATIEVEGAGAPVVDTQLTQPFRHPSAPRLVVCNHPALEAEAIAGELLAARREGAEWSDMAVLVRSHGAHGARADAIVRALARHGIAVDGAGAPAGAEPAVRAIVDTLQDMEREGKDGAPAELAFEIWARTAGALVNESSDGDAALDAVVAFIDALQRRAARRPRERLAEFLSLTDGYPSGMRARRARPIDLSAVTVTSINSAAGREWHTVVIAGCLEGEFPRLRARAALFDRHQTSLAEERRVFDAACNRATGQVIGIVAAAPGVLPSRFVESWSTSEPRLVAPPSRAGAGASLTPTPGTMPTHPDGHLRLSASRLSVYDDCPLRYAYEYVLGARSDAGVHAALGTLVHAVLAQFLDPKDPGSADLSRERLLSIAERSWRDDIAPYRPQVEEIRRDYFSMLEAWWQVEGGDSPLRPDVIDVEREFEIEVGPHTLTGFIDRVDRADDGEGVRVVDYKTGRTKPNAAQVADNIQLASYHLGASRDPTLAAFGAPTQLRLLYLREMRAYEQEVTPDHAAATEERILATANRILDEEFAPSVDADCRNCSYHRLCPLQPEGRQVAG